MFKEEYSNGLQQPHASLNIEASELDLVLLKSPTSRGGYNFVCCGQVSVKYNIERVRERVAWEIFTRAIVNMSNGHLELKMWSV